MSTPEGRSQSSGGLRLSSLISRERVLSNVEARSKKHALEILSELLTSNEEDLVADEAFVSLIRRERLGSTALGNGVAIPHGRVGGIDTSLGACMNLSDSIDFDAPDGQPVNLIFGLLVPSECSDEQLRDLTEMTTILADPALDEALRECTSSRALHDLLVQIDAERHADG